MSRLVKPALGVATLWTCMMWHEAWTALIILGALFVIVMALALQAARRDFPGLFGGDAPQPVEMTPDDVLAFDIAMAERAS